MLLLLCLPAAAGVTECGAVGGGAVGGAPVATPAVNAACAALRAGGECPSAGHCKIAIVGDSIPTRPAPGSNDLGTNLQALLTADCATVDNFASSGHHCDSVVATQYPDNVEGNGYHVIINNCGVNDLNGSYTAASTLSDRESIAASVLAEDGPLLLDLSVMPWGGFTSHTAAKQTETDSLNVSLSTPINAATQYLDTYTGMEDDVVPDALEADYDSGDGLHPGSAGASALASIIFTELTTP